MAVSGEILAPCAIMRSPNGYRGGGGKLSKASCVLYYDGDCGLCNWVVRSLSRLDRSRVVTWTPYQSLEQPPGGLTWSDLDSSAYLETESGRLHEGFYAFRALTIRLPLLLPLAPIMWMPGVGLAGVPVYRWVARHRRRFFPCRVPPPGARG